MHWLGIGPTAGEVRLREFELIFRRLLRTRAEDPDHELPDVELPERVQQEARRREAARRWEGERA